MGNCTNEDYRRIGLRGRRERNGPRLGALAKNRIVEIRQKTPKTPKNAKMPKKRQISDIII